MPILHGVNASPFVRKVRATLAFKGLDYELNPVMPMGVSEEYRRKSPLGKIPCWEEEDGFVLPDSSAICAYLERVQPEPALYPGDPKPYGRALWYEEYADTKVAEVVGAGIFFERVVKAKVLKQPADEEKVRETLETKLPPVLDYLEAEAPESGDALLGGRFSIADVAVGTQLAQLAHAQVQIDAGRWPRLAAYAAAVHAHPVFKPLLEEEAAQLAAMGGSA